jgi:hypothetical protein
VTRSLAPAFTPTAPLVQETETVAEEDLKTHCQAIEEEYALPVSRKAGTSSLLQSHLPQPVASGWAWKKCAKSSFSIRRPPRVRRKGALELSDEQFGASTVIEILSQRSGRMGRRRGITLRLVVVALALVLIRKVNRVRR